MTELHPLYQQALASGDAYQGDDGVVRVSSSSRGRWKHWQKDYPLVIDASGTQLRPYKRVTTHISTTDSGGFGLTNYELVLQLLGLRRDPKLWRQVRDLLDPAATYDDLKANEAVWKRLLGDPSAEDPELRDGLLKKVKLKGGGDDATAWGDLIHKVTEVYEAADRKLSAVEVIEHCNDVLVRYVETVKHSRGSAAPNMKTVVNSAIIELEAYAKAMEPFRVVAQEFFVVNDDLETAGSGDCLIEYGPMPELLIGDKKTGKNAMNYMGKKSMQKAEYAHGTPYSFSEGRLAWDRPISDRWGLLIAMPGDGRCLVNWVNIAWGWDEIVETFPVVEAHKDYRTQKGLLVPFVPGELPTNTYTPRAVSTPPVVEEPPLLASVPEPTPVKAGADQAVVAEIKAAKTREDVVAVWRRLTGGKKPHPAWLPEYQQATTARLAEIQKLLDEAGNSAAA